MSESDRVLLNLLDVVTRLLFAALFALIVHVITESDILVLYAISCLAITLASW